LKMKPAHRTAGPRQGLIVLNEHTMDSKFVKIARGIGFNKIAACIDNTSGGDEQHVWKCKRIGGELGHRRIASFRTWRTAHWDNRGRRQHYCTVQQARLSGSAWEACARH